MLTLRPIVSKPLVRPQFNNANLQNPGVWMLDNAAALSLWFAEQGRAVGISDEDTRDIDIWLEEQWRSEKRRQCLPHGSSL